MTIHSTIKKNTKKNIHLKKSRVLFIEFSDNPKSFLGKVCIILITTHAQLFYPFYFIVCESRTFGNNCSMNCYCFNDQCNKTTGTCPPGGCERGYTGITCSTGIRWWWLTLIYSLPVSIINDTDGVEYGQVFFSRLYLFVLQYDMFVQCYSLYYLLYGLKYILSFWSKNIHWFARIQNNVSVGYQYKQFQLSMSV